MQYLHIFSVISSHLESIATAGGYPFLFLTVFFEGVPLLGTLVPGHVAIITAGFLARISVLNIWWVLSLSLIAAISGDFLGFALGRKYGISLIDRLRPYFFIKDSHIEKATALLAKHTGKSMIIGRFSPITRALMPFLVGTSETPVHRFWLFNILGAIAWVVSSICIGYIFGFGYHAAAGYVGKLVLVALICGVLILWGYRFVNVRFHVFKRYELFALALNFIALYALAKTIQDASAVSSFMASFDVWTNIFMNAHITPFLLKVAGIVTTTGGTVVIAIGTVIISVMLALRKRWRLTIIMLFSIGTTGFLVGVMKQFFMRVRPGNALYILSDYSFPSGHAAFAAAFFTLIAYMAMLNVKSWVKREIIVVCCVIAIIVVGLSRIALNVHWASDVIAGWALGVFVATGSILLVRYVAALIVKKK